MELRNNLYTIKNRQWDGHAGSYLLTLNPESVIYQAHFPGDPITPGVCIVQMGKEILEDATGMKMEIVSVKNVKFLSIISPDDTQEITYLLNKVEWLEKAGLSCDGTPCTDASGQNLRYLKAQITVMAGDDVKAKISFTLRQWIK